MRISRPLESSFVTLSVPLRAEERALRGARRVAEDRARFVAADLARHRTARRPGRPCRRCSPLADSRRNPLMYLPRPRCAPGLSWTSGCSGLGLNRRLVGSSGDQLRRPLLPLVAGVARDRFDVRRQILVVDVVDHLPHAVRDLVGRIVLQRDEVGRVVAEQAVHAERPRDRVHRVDDEARLPARLRRPVQVLHRARCCTRPRCSGAPRWQVSQPTAPVTA